MLNRKFFIHGLMALSLSVSTSTTACSWLWPWSETTRYNGACTLENKTFKGLEIHGAATLRNLTITKSLLVTGSTDWQDTTVQGSTTIRGTLKATGGSITGNVELSGGLKAQSLQISGITEISGNLTAHNLTMDSQLIVKGSIDAIQSNFAGIVAKGDRNHTYRFNASPFKTLDIIGAGTRIVILTNTSVDTITFENKGGIVKLNGSATVKNPIVNGTIEKQ